MTAQRVCRPRYLQAMEALPTDAEREHPDEQRAAGVDGRSRRPAEGLGDRDAEEIEKGD